jgi:hypothetical protein
MTSTELKKYKDKLVVMNYSTFKYKNEYKHRHTGRIIAVGKKVCLFLVNDEGDEITIKIDGIADICRLETGDISLDKIR